MSHFKTLLNIVEDDGVPVSYGDYTVYFGNAQEIQLEKDRSESASIAGLAHEYGHHLSQMNGHWDKNELRRAIIKENYNVWSLSPTDRITLFLEEIRAWRLGAAELKRIGFDKWGSYSLIAFYCLMTYVLTFMEPIIILCLSCVIFIFTYEILDLYETVSVGTLLINIGFSIWTFLLFCTISVMSHDNRHRHRRK
jgi:hypothetical protein